MSGQRVVGFVGVATGRFYGNASFKLHLRYSYGGKDGHENGPLNVSKLS